MVESEAQFLAERAKREIEIANLNWAFVEALNNQHVCLEAALTRHQAWQPAKFAVKAVARDVIATLMRVTDGEGSQRDLTSLGRFVSVIEGHEDQLIATANNYLREIWHQVHERALAQKLGLEDSSYRYNYS